MPRISIKDKRKAKAVNKILNAARASVVAGRRSAPAAPAATRGFYGSYTKRGRSELKVIENAVTSIPTVSTAGSVVALNLVAQGTDFTNRVGRVTRNKSLLWRCMAKSENTATNSEGEVVRVMLLYDSQPNSAGAVPAVTDVLTSADIYSGMNLSNRDRFKVLWDKRLILWSNNYTANVLTAGSPHPVWKEKFLRFDLETVYSGTGGTIGNIGTGSLLMLNIALNGSVAELQYYSRVRFTDP